MEQTLAKPADTTRPKLSPFGSRIQSIDVLRALTMFLMIFVNDVDGVEKIPEWIKHAKASEDALGFADTIFPAFLFIVGLSIPHAINSRLKKGASKGSIFFHIALRSLALLIMGVFHVNLESYGSAAVLPKAVWEILITIGFFLVWLDFSKLKNKTLQYTLQAAGILLLAGMALIFQGGTPADPEPFQPHWWGILGLIGWSYLICSVIYLVTGKNTLANIVALAFFLLFNIAQHSGWLDSLSGVRNYFWIVGSGSMPGFTMAGVVASLMYTNLAKDGPAKLFTALIAFAVIMFVFGFATRPIAGISKIRATPAWVGICNGISILGFALMIWLADMRKKAGYFSVIRPAGTSTLTCYLIPYLLYSFFVIVHFHYPTFLSEGIGGILRSFAVAFVVIWITGLLEKVNIRLKI